MTKVCSKCGIEKDVSEFYNRHYKTKDGTIKKMKIGRCKVCSDKDTHSYYHKRLQKDREKITVTRKCLVCGKPFTAHSKKAMYCSGSCKGKACRNRDEERYKKRCDKYADKYREKRQRIRSLYDIFYIKRCQYCNKTFITNSKSRTNCSDRCRINKSKKHRYNTNIEYKILHTLRSSINARLRKGIVKSGTTMELTGVSLTDLMFYLESQFTEGMSWDNHGYYGWHIDHIRPCSSFDLTDPEQQKLCFHYTNMQPLWAIDNLRKSDKWDG